MIHFVHLFSSKERVFIPLAELIEKCLLTIILNCLAKNQFTILIFSQAAISFYLLFKCEKSA